jgi:hypothetical protein
MNSGRVEGMQALVLDVFDTSTSVYVRKMTARLTKDIEVVDKSVAKDGVNKSGIAGACFI